MIDMPPFGIFAICRIAPIVPTRRRLSIAGSSSSLFWSTRKRRRSPLSARLTESTDAGRLIASGCSVSGRTTFCRSAMTGSSLGYVRAGSVGMIQPSGSHADPGGSNDSAVPYGADAGVIGFRDLARHPGGGTMGTLTRLVAASTLALALGTSAASAQVQTGSIAGVVTDASNAVLPGVTVSLSGEKLIGGTQSQVTDLSGSYRFDRLPPGSYRLKFELPGFRTVEHDDIIVNAAFIASVNGKMEVGSVSEAITVTGQSPTVDTKSNLQQTVMNQDVLEGVPTGRDPWSVAKLIPGVQVSTYDVGGTQSFQQSSLSSHGSNTNDVSYNIDGATVNWPGGGGGATMLYYDQGMFEEVNYMTSAIPAEVMVGGVSINMVTKDAGNKWRGDARYNFSSGCLTPQAPTPGCLESDNLAPGIAAGKIPSALPGNPTQTTWDFNLAGGGAVVQDRLWVNGSVRRWIVDRLVSAKNIDGTQAIDDNTLKNYSGKSVFSLDKNQKIAVWYNSNNKIDGHRYDTPPDVW